MIKNNQGFLNILHLLLDIVIICVSYAAAILIILGHNLPFYFSVLYYPVHILWIVPLFLIVYRACHMYTPKRLMTKLDIVKIVFGANAMALLVFSLALYVLRKHWNLMHFSVRVLFCFIIITTVLELIERLSIKKVLSTMRSKGYNLKHLVLVGYSDASNRLVDAIHRNPEWGYKVDAVLDDLVDIGTEYRGAKVKGKLQDLAKVLNEKDIDVVAITLPLSAYNKLEDIVKTCDKYGVHTKFIPDYTEIINSNMVTEDLDGVAAINIRNVPLNDPSNKIIKRVSDIILSILFIIIFSPVMLITAIGVKLTSPGPILFKQKRVGYHNKEFNMYKFRSMREQSPEDEEKGWTVKGDPRVTKFGAFIRKTSIDELPQFFNVLFGNMSIVGPRPERKQFVEQFMEVIPRYNVKHQVRPGITGWAQVNGLRGDTSIPERIRYDLYYIENWSLWFDIKIMFLTVFKGFINKNAY